MSHLIGISPLVVILVTLVLYQLSTANCQPPIIYSPTGYTSAIHRDLLESICSGRVSGLPSWMEAQV